MFSQLRALVKERDSVVDTKTAELRRADENLVRLRKESERQANKYKQLSTGTSSQKEAELQGEVDKFMVSPVGVHGWMGCSFGFLRSIYRRC
jgi:E3 ubiquitin-protein ligase BRE1